MGWVAIAPANRFRNTGYVGGGAGRVFGECASMYGDWPTRRSVLIAVG
jgi:hypothetical protein